MVQPSWSLTLDWKGFSRTEVYYESSPEDVYYGNLHLILKPEIKVTDSLSIFTRLDLYPFSAFEQDDLGQGQAENIFLNRAVFLNSIKSLEEAGSADPLFFNLSQIYLTYKTEFFNFKLGKAPYHFGLGVTYSAETSSFDNWISTFNQMAFYFEYSSFYFQPSFLLVGKDLLSVNQIGMQGNEWNAEALVRYNFKFSKFFVEAFGVYKQDSIDTKLSISYSFEDEDSLKLAVIFEGGVDLPINLASRFDLKAGYVSEEGSLHPNYDVSLLIGNRMTKSLDGFSPNEASIVEGQISDMTYLSPRFSFYFFQDILKITPIVSFNYGLSEKELLYEFDLQAHYNLEENFSILIQAGFLPGLKKNYYGLLTQAAVTF